MSHWIILALTPLILSIGIIPAIPFGDADSTIPSAKSNPDNAFTAATFAHKYKDMQFTGKTVSVVITVVGESENTDPAKRAKEIRYLQNPILKFLSFSNAVNVVSNQEKNEITAQIDSGWIPILEKRSDVVSVNVSSSFATDFTQICIDKVWIENKKGKIACVTPSTAEKLVERGWGTMFVEMMKEQSTKDEKSILPVVSGGMLPITETPIVGNPEKEFPKNYVPGSEELTEDEIRLTFLGTGMPFPTRNQAAAGILMEFGNGEILMFDIGSGTVANFNSLYISPADLTKFFITHLHTDHQGDLDMFWAQGVPFGRILPMHVWGPTGDGHALGTQAFVDGMLAANLWDLKSREGNIPTSGAEVIAHEFDWKKTQVIYEEDGITVTSFPAIHAMAGAVSYRIDWNDTSIVYSGDTKINNFMIEQGQDVDLLIHETFLPAEILSEKTGMSLENAMVVTNEIHTPAKAAGVIFELTQPKMAVMYHTWVTEETIPLLFDELRIPYLGPATLAQDLTVFNITPNSIVVRQALVDDAPWPIVPQESSHAEKSEEVAVLPQWLLDQSIDMDEAIQEILENNN